MSVPKESMKNELGEKIAAFEQEALPNIPPAIYPQLQKYIAELVQPEGLRRAPPYTRA